MTELIYVISNSNSKHKKAVYKCDCGNEFVAFVSNITTGHTKSCGCLRDEATRERSTIHGHRTRRTKVYVAWVNMKQRCGNEGRADFANYGGRGITYCVEWEDFEVFLRDMGEPKKGMSLDRIDNSLGYSKKNCRWATATQQALNKRNCVRYELNGKNQTLAEWARETGIGRITMLKRIQRNVPLELALTVKGFLDMRQYGVVRGKK